jgi:hypothetical protein
MRTDSEFNDVMKSLLKDDIMLTQQLQTAISQVDEDKRVLSFIFSTPSQDRKGDTLNNSGWLLEDFNKNPVFLWSHNIEEQPIGIVKNLSTSNGNLVGDVHFWVSKRDPLLWSEFDKKADSIYEQYKLGFLKGVSVRFKPVEFEPSKVNKNGIAYKKQYLVEISAVSIPDNADSLKVEKVSRVDTQFNVDDFATQLAKLIK